MRKPRGVPLSRQAVAIPRAALSLRARGTVRIWLLVSADAIVRRIVPDD